MCGGRSWNCADCYHDDHKRRQRKGLETENEKDKQKHSTSGVTKFYLIVHGRSYCMFVKTDCIIKDEIKISLFKVSSNP